MAPEPAGQSERSVAQIKNLGIQNAGHGQGHIGGVYVRGDSFLATANPGRRRYPFESAFPHVGGCVRRPATGLWRATPCPILDPSRTRPA